MYFFFANVQASRILRQRKAKLVQQDIHDFDNKVLMHEHDFTIACSGPCHISFPLDAHPCFTSLSSLGDRY
jgi:hypothetical protein